MIKFTHAVDNILYQDLIITENTVIKGQVMGKVKVNGACVDMRGLILGDLIVGIGAEVYIKGTVIGEVINEGGTLFVAGLVNGTIKTNSGTTHVDYKARVLNPSLEKRNTEIFVERTKATDPTAS